MTMTRHSDDVIFVAKSKRFRRKGPGCKTPDKCPLLRATRNGSVPAGARLAAVCWRINACALISQGRGCVQCLYTCDRTSGSVFVDHGVVSLLQSIYV